MGGHACTVVTMDLRIFARVPVRPYVCGQDTKWPGAIPLKDQTADTVAKAFYANWIARFGVPDVITSD
ncbi:hypothetical protein JTE90_000407 [Oedothorax gibbosus]|uniref:Uncharacterized protein n=1 Tax=Oedothorax gibbosus TaxID=931172 RepID=A0AAV6UR43_9ARAC|nr:hypothetical protein JTE90_000407 [Oedothorax gibbosus]